MSRSRSSTVSSRSDSSREYYATNPQQLLAPSHDTARGFAADDLEASVANGSGDGWRDGGAGGESWRSELSLKTVRGRRGSDASDDTLDASGGAGGERAEGGGEGSMLLPKGATIIDLSPATGGRPRAHTFGGVEIPPTPDPSKPVPPTPNPPAPPPHSPPLLRPIPRSRSISNASSVSLHLGGDSWTTRRPVLWAGCKGAMLLACSLAFLWLVLHTLLPPLDEGDEQYVKIPKSFDQLKELNGVLQVYKERHYWRVLGCYMTVYLFLQAFSIPGSMYLSILGGAMYGVLIALPLACFCVATGALLCYLISQQLGPAILLNSEKWQKRVEKWTERIAEHNDNLISYLIVLRIAPLPPHWVVNVVAPHLGISIWTFWISTFFGIMGVSFIHTQIGTTLDQMTSASDFHLISWQNGVGLGGIIIAVLIPVFMRRAWKKDLDQAAMDNDDASLLPVPNISITIPSSLPRLSMDRDHKIRLSYNSEEDLSKGYEEERDARARNFEIGGSDSEDDDAAESSNSGKGKERAVSPVYGGNGVAGGGDMKKASKLLGVDVGGPGRGGNEAGWGGR